jgi:dTDP-4-dehydrorhamnose 3,5-epimerase
MEFRATRFEGLFLINPKIAQDERGFSFEQYNRRLFLESGIKADFVQDYVSSSHKNVLRGLHFQRKPFCQGKLVSVLHGTIKDAIVDLRQDSKTYGQWESFVLGSQNRDMIYVPEGFAHGFLALEDSLVHYKLTGSYNKESEGGIIWNDAELNIDWGITNPTISEKDKKLPEFKTGLYVS